jgi:hypothetical protein
MSPTYLSKRTNLRNTKQEQRNTEKSVKFQKKFTEFGINEQQFNQNAFLLDLDLQNLQNFLNQFDDGENQLGLFNNLNNRKKFGFPEKVILVFTLMFLSAKAVEYITFDQSKTSNLDTLRESHTLKTKHDLLSKSEEKSSVKQKNSEKNYLFFNEKKTELTDTKKTIGNTGTYPVYSDGKNEYIVKKMSEQNIVQQALITTLFPVLTSYPDSIKVSSFRIGRVNNEWVYLNQILKTFSSVDEISFTIETGLYVLELLRVASLLDISDLHDGNFGLSQEGKQTTFVLVDTDRSDSDWSGVFSCFSLCSVFQKIDTKQFALIETKIDQFFSVQSGQKTPTLAFIMQKLEPLLGSYFIKKYKTEIERKVNNYIQRSQPDGRYVAGKNLINHLLKDLTNIPANTAKEYIEKALQDCFGINWK